MELNIVELIEQNPITTLSNTYQCKLLTKIQSKFTDNDQRLFVSSFYGYLHYTSSEFVIDLDKIWKWLGFSQKIRAKELLEKCFKIDIDYKTLLSVNREQNQDGRGGHNKKTIMLTVKTFKSYCLKAGTKKADQIHDYYLKLEETLHEIINEENTELKLHIKNNYEKSQKDRELVREQAILEQFPRNTQCIYYGLIDDTNDTNDKLIKFGHSNFLCDRVDSHKKTYTNFRLLNAFKVDNKTQIENSIKTHPILSTYRRITNINSINHNELIAITELTLETLERIIKEIIISNEYNPENYKKILEDNEFLKNKNIQLTKENILYKKYETILSQNTHLLLQSGDLHVNTTQSDTQSKIDVIVLTEENKKLKFENIKLMKKYKITKQEYSDIDESVSTQIIVDDLQYNNIANSLKRITKSVDGLYRIDGRIYKKCFGTRDEVWHEISYKTTGDLLKIDLMLNKHGKIVSKKKFISESQNNRLEFVNNQRIISSTLIR